MKEIKQVKLKVLTPIHIGTGQKFTKGIDFFLKGNKYGVVDDHKVLNVLGEENVDKWVNSIDQNESILPYIQQRKPDYSLADLCKRVMNVNSSGKSRDAREMLHSSQGQPLIPGSSIKGSIRTSFWNNLVNQKIELEEIEENWRGKISYKDKKLSEKAFGKNPNKDIFRFLQISDFFFDKNYGNIELLDVLTLKNDGWKPKGFGEYAETISEEAISKSRFSLSTKLLKENLARRKIFHSKGTDFMKSFSSIMKVCNDNTITMLNGEKAFFENDLTLNNSHLLDNYLEKINDLIKIAEKINNGCIIRLGHGTGYRFITGNKINNIENDRDLERILRSVRKDWKGRYDDFAFIKSRKMTSNGIPLGFIQLSI